MNKTETHAYMLVSVTAFLLTTILYMVKPSLYEVLLGSVNPLALVLILGVLGYLFASKLAPLGFAIYKPIGFIDRLPSLGVAVCLGLGIVLVDNFSHLPEDVNILLPYSLLYYPVFGYIVEVLFHLMPLYVSLVVFNRFNGLCERKTVYCIMLVSLLEPVFQLGLGFSSQIPI